MGVLIPEKLLDRFAAPEKAVPDGISDIDFAGDHRESFTDNLVQNVALFMGLFGILRSLIRNLVVDTFAPQPFFVSMVVSGYLFYVWSRMKRGHRIPYAGEKVVSLVTLNTAYLVYLSGGLIGPVFPLLIMLPLLSVMLCGRNGGIWMILFLAPFMAYIFHLNISHREFQVLKITPTELFQMRALTMVISTAIVAAMSLYFITTNNRLLMLISRQANTDYLTGLLNRRSFESGLADEIRRAARYDTPLSVVIMDIDNFKQINDNYGHLAGDKCLIHLANIIRDNLKRPADFAGRYGGEEFVLVLPETDSTGGLYVAETLRKNVENTPLALAEGAALPFTISLGVCTAEYLKEVDADKLLNEADSMMYLSKQAGKNRVKGTVIADQGTSKVLLTDLAI